MRAGASSGAGWADSGSAKRRLRTELKLYCRTGMLLRPKGDKRFREPSPHGRRAVDSRVAGGAQGNQQRRIVIAGAAVVHGEETAGAAGAAGEAVAL